MRSRAAGLALAWAAGLALWIVAGIALAQEAPTGVPDVPGGPATLRGRVVHATRPGSARDVQVALFSLTAEGRPGLRGAVTDAQGEFVFENVSNDPGIAYLVAARHAEVPFRARVVFDEDELERVVEIEIRDPSRDGSGVSVGTSRLRVERSCADLRIHEIHELRNPGERVIHVPEGERAGAEPLFRTALPEAALGFTTPFGGLEPGLEIEGGMVTFWGPLQPGTRSLEFSYGLPLGASPLSLRRVFTSGAERVAVLTDPQLPPARGDGLEAGPEERSDGRSFTSRQIRDVAPGRTLEFSLEIPAASGPSAQLSLEESQLWLELDDAALTVDEQHRIATSGTETLRSSGGAPLLCLPIPARAMSLRFSAESLALGLEPDSSGAIAVMGPIPPGTSALALRYQIPSGDGATVFERRFAGELPRLSLLIADTGVVPESERLHRLRPVRSGERSYLQLEAFQIERDEVVQVTLRPLSRPRPVPRLVAAGGVLAAALAATWFLSAPLRGRPVEVSGADRPEPSTSAEREAIYAALADLEEDFETDKLEASDYERMRGELRARAVDLLRAERDRKREAPQGEASREPSEAHEARCGACAAELPAEARFCPQCGVRVAVEPERRA